MIDGQDNPQSKSVEAPEDALRPGDLLLHGQYRIDKYLNAGGFGITYLAFDSLDRIVVIKECFPNSMCCRSQDMVQARSSSHQKEFQAVVRNFGQEAMRMAKLKHPNIVGVHQVFEDNGTAYMALDFVQGRDLLDVIEHDREKLTPAEIKRILLKLLDAIAYVHERDVLHRDISPDNILLDYSSNPVLIDFGAAREVATRASRALSTMHVVKDGYSPQEFYIANGAHTASSDLYSLAATFYHLITGAAPPNSQTRLAALAANEADPYEPIPPRTEGYDHFFLGALDKALAVFPKHRMATAVEWIEEIDKERRQKAMVERAKIDEEIDFSIRQLTAETNKALLGKSDIDQGRGSQRGQTGAIVKGTPSSASNVARNLKAYSPVVKTEKAVPAASRLVATRSVSAPRVMSQSGKSDPDQLAGTSELRAAKVRPAPLRRSLFARIISVPFWLFVGSRQSKQHKNGGFEQ